MRAKSRSGRVAFLTPRPLSRQTHDMRTLGLAVISISLGALSLSGCAKDDDAASSGAFMDNDAADTANIDGGGTAITAGETGDGSADDGADVPSNDSGESSSSTSSGGDPGCGDGMITPPEQCDGNDLDGYTCESLGYTGGGQLSCDPVTCTLDTSNCIPGSGGSGSTGM